MDYGPFLTTTLEVDRDNIANKAIAIRLDAGPGGVSQGNVFVAFDTDTLRMAAGWTGSGFIDWRSVVFDGSHQTHPSLVGRRVFVTPRAPGWGRPTDGSFADPRVRGTDKLAYGPLPRSWGQWQGLYRTADGIVLSYRVGSTAVWELPSAQTVGDDLVLSRSFEVGPRETDLILQVAGDPRCAARVETVRDEHGRIYPVVLVTPTELAADVRAAGAARSAVTFDGSRFVQIRSRGALNMSTADYTVTARVRTTEGGTILSKAAPDGPWVPDGKTLFVRDGRLCFDIGWVGALQSRQRINDGQWHDVAMTYHAGTGMVRLYVDHQLDGEGVLRPKGPLDDGVVRLGFTSTNFPTERSAFVGEMEFVRFYQQSFDDPSLAGRESTPAPHPLADWRPSDQSASWTDVSGNGHGGEWNSLPGSDSDRTVVAIGIVGGDGCQWHVTEDGDVRLRIEAGRQACRFRVVYAPSSPEQGTRALVAYLGTAPAPGSPRAAAATPARLWPEVLETTVRRWEPGRGPFVVEELTLPVENPWRSWLRLGGLDVCADGDRAVICSWQGDVWSVSGVRDGRGRLRWQRIASGLFQPLGLKVVDDAVYVLGRDQITRLRDLDGDGETDYYECFNHDAQVTDHFHEFAMDLQTDSAGDFFYMKAARHALPAVVPQHGTLMRVSRDGSTSQIVAGGFRAPDGLLVDDDGTCYTTDQEGHWTPQNRMNRIRPGGFYGNMMAANPAGRHEDDTDPPVCWIHRDLDRSPAAPVRVPADRWGPLGGSLLSLSYGTGKVFRIFEQDAGDTLQGGITQLPIPEFPTGIQRGRFHPIDGMLYVAGLFGWSSDKTLAGGLYRIDYRPGPLHGVEYLEATDTGVALRFDVPVDSDVAVRADCYAVSRWNAKRTANYGSDDYRVSDGKPGRDAVEVAGVSVSRDGRTVFLHIPSMQVCMLQRIRYQLRAADGMSLSGVVDHTVHRLPTAGDSLVGAFADRLTAPSPRTAAPRGAERLEAGLVLQIATEGADEAQVPPRIARLITLRADPSEPTAPWSGRGPFVARWDGYLKAELSESVQLAAQLRGDLLVTVNDLVVIRASTVAEEQITSAPIVLQGGINRISVRLDSQRDGGALLRLLWSREGDTAEPIRPSVLFHDPSAVPDRVSQLAAFRGREMFAWYHCHQCHALPDRGERETDLLELQRDAPSLERVVDRLEPDWLARWLEDPVALRNNITMPSVWPEHEQEVMPSEITDIVSFLQALSREENGGKGGKETWSEDSSQDDLLCDDGLVLYEDLGCIACHHFDPPATDDPYERTSLHFVGAKYVPGALLAFLRQPREHHAWSRMPDYQLTDDESRGLAAYLLSRALPREELEPLSLAAGDPERGRETFQRRGCQACHRLDADRGPEPQNRPLWPAPDPTRGCLAEQPDLRGTAPQFVWDEGQRADLAAFLATDGTSLFKDDSAAATRRLVDSLRCLACHRRDDQMPWWPEILGDEGEQGHPAEFLPPLTWTGEKLQADYVERLLGGRLQTTTRPWKKGRMPAWPSYARVLAEGLAIEHGQTVLREPVERGDEIRQGLGARLIDQDEGFNCVQCHAAADVPPEAAFESRGIDFPHVTDRLRHEFFHRWMAHPIQFDSAVSMPRFSPDGRTTPVQTMLDGNAHEQFQAIWTYLLSIEQKQ